MHWPSASQAILGRAIEYTEADLQRVMSPRHFVEMRTTRGGPAPSETARAIGVSRGLLATDRGAWQARRDRLTAAEAALKARVRAL